MIRAVTTLKKRNAKAIFMAVSHAAALAKTGKAKTNIGWRITVHP